MRSLRARLRGRGGMTLAELLMTVLILAMVMAVVAAGVPAAVRAYRGAVESANAQVYLSTVMTELRGELGLASDVSVEDGVIRYRSADGLAAALSSDSSGIRLQYSGESLPGAMDAPRLLVAQPASGSDDLVAQFELDSVPYADGVITFRSVTVRRDGDTLAEAGPYQIRVLAAPTP